MSPGASAPPGGSAFPLLSSHRQHGVRPSCLPPGDLPQEAPLHCKMSWLRGRQLREEPPLSSVLYPGCKHMSSLFAV